MTIPTTEPTELRAGDSWAWRREDLTDYPATAWALTYQFRSETAGFQITATADGDNFAVAEPGADTDFDAGAYEWVAWVDDGAGAIHTVGHGRTKLLPNLRAGNAGDALDLRTHARKVLAAIEAVIENRASKDQQSYTIGNRRLDRIPVEQLIAMRDKYRAEAKAEERAEKISKGLGTSGRITVRC